MPTGILALSSMTRYSHSPGRPERSLATMSKPICRFGTYTNRVGIEVSKRALLSTTSLGTTSSFPASRCLNHSLIARIRWARPSARTAQSAAGTMRGMKSVGCIPSSGTMPNSRCFSISHPRALCVLRPHSPGPIRTTSSARRLCSVKKARRRDQTPRLKRTGHDRSSSYQPSAST